MSKGYESLKGIMQKTLHHSKPNPMAIARVKDSTASSLNDDMEELEKMVVDRIGRLKAAVKEGEAVVAGESEQAERVIESLRANIAVLEAKVKETEDTVRRKDSASQSMEKNLTAKIASLETHLSETEKIVREKDLTIKGLEQNLTAKIQDLESQLRNSVKLLVGRDTQINNLNSQLEVLTHGIKGMSSFFRQTDVLAAIDAQGISPVATGEQSKGGEEKPATSQFTGPAVTSNATDAAREVVPADFFAHVTHELAEILGPFSSVIVRDHVNALDESIEKFPKTRVTELVKNLSEEIADENLKIGFRERVDNLLIIGETVFGSSTIEQLPQGRSAPSNNETT